MIQIPKAGVELPTPAIILWNPKFAHNVGAVIRAASCFGIKTVVFTGNRVQLDLNTKSRLPREERMKGYKDVTLYNFDYPFDLFPKGWPIAIELVSGSENLANFQSHVDDAVYVFGPEDGGLHQTIKRLCYQFVTIPSYHCLNLSAAVYVTLYDRVVKRNQTGEENLPTIDGENRGFIETDLFDYTGSNR